jgi:hypothetical protein
MITHAQFESAKAIVRQYQEEQEMKRKNFLHNVFLGLRNVLYETGYANEKLQCISANFENPDEIIITITKKGE